MHANKFDLIVLNRELVPDKADTKINYMFRERVRGRIGPLVRVLIEEFWKMSELKRQTKTHQNDIMLKGGID